MNIEQLKAAFDELKKDADIAYCRYIDICDKECRGTEYHLENGTFSQQMLESYKLAYDMYGFHRGIHKALKEVRTLLDNAINAPDLSELKRETIEGVKAKWNWDKLNPDFVPRGPTIRACIDHLAPRIVREGFVVVPEEPTEDMMHSGLDQCKKDKLLHGNIYVGDIYKAMIAASKGIE